MDVYTLNTEQNDGSQQNLLIFVTCYVVYKETIGLSVSKIPRKNYSPPEEVLL